jgi:hypothetical protein
MTQRYTFAQIRKLANDNGFSMERHPKAGFRVWRDGDQRERYSNPVFVTLAAAKGFIEAEIESRTGCIDAECE